MDIPTAQKVLIDDPDRLQRIDSKDEFKAFWEHLKAQGHVAKGSAVCDPPTCWIEDEVGAVIAKWSDSFGPQYPEEFWVEKEQWVKWKESQDEPNNQRREH